MHGSDGKLYEIEREEKEFEQRIDIAYHDVVWSSKDGEKHETL